MTVDGALAIPSSTVDFSATLPSELAWHSACTCLLCSNHEVWPCWQSDASRTHAGDSLDAPHTWGSAATVAAACGQVPVKGVSRVAELLRAACRFVDLKRHEAGADDYGSGFVMGRAKMRACIVVLTNASSASIQQSQLVPLLPKSGSAQHCSL